MSEMLRFALRNLWSRPLRSLLSLLGLTVAIAGMVGLFSVAEGLDRQLTSTFGRIPGLVAMQPGAPIPLFSNLPAAWESEIAAIDGVHAVNAEIWQRVNVINGKMVVSPPRFLFGTDIETRLSLKADPYQNDLIEGRFLTVDDVGKFNTLVSRSIADESDLDVGSTFRVNGQDLTVVGIYECGSLLLDVAIILDLSVVRSMTRFPQESVCAFYIEPEDESDSDRLVNEIRELFRHRDLEAWQPSSNLLTADSLLWKLESAWNRLQQSVELTSQPPRDPPGNPEAPGQSSEDNASPRATGSVTDVDDELPLEVRKATDWGEKFDKMSDDLDLLLAILTGIGLTIAVLSIINTMLMSVSERIIEFGILKANGWSHRDVLQLITCESAILGLGGGVLGSATGYLAAQVVNARWPDRIELFASPQLLLFGVLFSTLLGTLGGLYPAIWAMRMQPMEAIRRG